MPYNDFILLFSGFLLTLSVYHFLLYFQHKDKVYLYYSLYTFLIFTSSYPNAETSGVRDVMTNSDGYLQFLIIPREWIYNTLYLVFAKTLVRLDIYKPKWNKILNIGIATFLITLILTILVAYISGENKIVGITFTYFFSPTIAVLALVSFYHLYTMDTGLKYYVLIGSFVYLTLAESAFYFFEDIQEATLIFYTGVIIENILFALALGHKQKYILEAKNSSQKKLINQLQENEKLKDTIQQQLEKNVQVLSKQAANEKLEKLKAEYGKELAELKMSSLRSQMNPHFIFNSLNAIKLYIIDNKKENAVYYLNKFSKLIRKILSTTREKEISLFEEIETVKLYIEIENIRFSNEIELLFTVDNKLSLNTIKIPSLILQPFVENAIWHGLSLKKENKKLSITISKKQETHIVVEIEDNGIGREKSSLLKQKKLYKRESIGINLTKERLRKFENDYKNNYSLKFEDLFDENRNASGTKVILKIPVY